MKSDDFDVCRRQNRPNCFIGLSGTARFGQGRVIDLARGDCNLAKLHGQLAKTKLRIMDDGGKSKMHAS